MKEQLSKNVQEILYLNDFILKKKMDTAQLYTENWKQQPNKLYNIKKY